MPVLSVGSAIASILASESTWFLSTRHAANGRRLKRMMREKKRERVKEESGGRTKRERRGHDRNEMET
jgi:hypothetical protein